MRVNYIGRLISKVMQKRWKLLGIKDYCCFISLLAFGQFSGHFGQFSGVFGQFSDQNFEFETL